MKFSPCLDAVYRGSSLSTADQMARVATLGYTAVEFWSWWDKDIDAIARTSDRHGLTITSVCTKFASLVNPDERPMFLSGLTETLVVARRLGCRTLIGQTGNVLPGVPRSAQRQSLVEGLKSAAPLLEAEGVVLALEPLNDRIDHRGYYLVSSQEAFEVVSEVDSPNVQVLYDVYHQQVSEGNLIPTITANLGQIAHIHIADHPGRHQPGTGEIHYGNLLSAVEEAGYTGYVGLEYMPIGHPDASLAGFLQEYGIQ